jgi:hypothetical protein
MLPKPTWYEKELDAEAERAWQAEMRRRPVLRGPAEFRARFPEFADAWLRDDVVFLPGGGNSRGYVMAYRRLGPGGKPGNVVVVNDLDDGYLAKECPTPEAAAAELAALESLVPFHWFELAEFGYKPE